MHWLEKCISSSASDIRIFIALQKEDALSRKNATITRSPCLLNPDRICYPRNTAKECISISLPFFVLMEAFESCFLIMKFLISHLFLFFFFLSVWIIFQMILGLWIGCEVHLEGFIHSVFLQKQIGIFLYFRLC